MAGQGRAGQGRARADHRAAGMAGRGQITGQGSWQGAGRSPGSWHGRAGQGMTKAKGRGNSPRPALLIARLPLSLTPPYPRRVDAFKS
jgi:hypothetical protein